MGRFVTHLRYLNCTAVRVFCSSLTLVALLGSWLVAMPCMVSAQAGGGGESPSVTYQASGDSIIASIGPVTTNYSAVAGQPVLGSINELLPCCNATCNPWNLIGCPPGGHCCTWGDGEPCDGPNCECFPECSLTCGVGGATCPEQCLFGPGAPIPACNAICAAIVSAMMAACEAAMASGGGAISFNGITIGCGTGEQITGCSPIQEACAISGCQECGFCTAIGLCGVKIECGDEDDVTPTPSPTPTPTAQPTAPPGGSPTAFPTATPHADGSSPELFLRQ